MAAYEWARYAPQAAFSKVCACFNYRYVRAAFLLPFSFATMFPTSVDETLDSSIEEIDRAQR